MQPPTASQVLGEDVAEPNLRGSARAFDLIVGMTLLAIALPILGLTALLVALFDGFPVIYRSKRVSADGAVFLMFKFRTMRSDADRHGPITSSGDARTTRLGSWLRRSKVDELPQLFNVIKGDMSIVGPRPEDPGLAKRYPSWAQTLLTIRPGLTSPASVEFRDEGAINAAGDVETYERLVLPAKLRIDLAYFRHRTARSDVGIVVQTLTAWLK